MKSDGDCWNFQTQTGEANPILEIHQCGWYIEEKQMEIHRHWPKLGGPPCNTHCRLRICFYQRPCALPRGTYMSPQFSQSTEETCRCPLASFTIRRDNIMQTNYLYCASGAQSHSTVVRVTVVTTNEFRDPKQIKHKTPKAQDGDRRMI